MAHGEAPNWTEEVNSEKEANKECFCFMDDYYVTLLLWHFSWTAIPANTETKIYCLSTYKSRSPPPGQFPIRVYCTPDVEKYHHVSTPKTSL